MIITHIRIEREVKRRSPCRSTGEKPNILILQDNRISYYSPDQVFNSDNEQNLFHGSNIDDAVYGMDRACVSKQLKHNIFEPQK